jgi:hypothetical protein
MFNYSKAFRHYPMVLLRHTRVRKRHSFHGEILEPQALLSFMPNQ